LDFGLAMGLAADAVGEVIRGFFEIAAMGLRYHPASGAQIPHPIRGVAPRRRPLSKQMHQAAWLRREFLTG
jgi:hypothetical protein